MPFARERGVNLVDEFVGKRALIRCEDAVDVHDEPASDAATPERGDRFRSRLADQGERRTGDDAALRQVRDVESDVRAADLPDAG